MMMKHCVPSARIRIRYIAFERKGVPALGRALPTRKLSCLKDRRCASPSAAACTRAPAPPRPRPSPRSSSGGSISGDLRCNGPAGSRLTHTTRVASPRPACLEQQPQLRGQRVHVRGRHAYFTASTARELPAASRTKRRAAATSTWICVHTTSSCKYGREVEVGWRCGGGAVEVEGGGA